jgi:hypothetical protein
MDLFKFVKTGSGPSTVGEGEVINDLKSKLWIERYREAGEFKLTAGLESDIRNKLPEGTLISHVDTREIMVVENHQIVENAEDGESEIVVTGRSLETFLEQRIIGANRAWPAVSGSTPPTYSLSSAYTWLQTQSLVNTYIRPSLLVDNNDILPEVEVVVDASLSGATGIQEVRTLNRKEDVYKTALGLLEVDDLGIKVLRPDATSPAYRDFEATYSLTVVAPETVHGQWPNFFFRCQNTASIGAQGPRSSYSLELDLVSNKLDFIRRGSAGNNVSIANTSGTLDGVTLGTDATKRNYRVTMVGTTMMAKWWHDGNPEPVNWMLEATDTNYTYGAIGLFSVSNVPLSSDLPVSKHRYDNMVISCPPGNPIFSETWTGTDGAAWDSSKWGDYLETVSQSTYTIQSNSGELAVGRNQIVAKVTTPKIPYTVLNIHKGVDKSKNVMFSYGAGDISAAEYLWSIKKLKTSALVSGKWVEVMIHGSQVGYDRRVMFVDASDLDDSLSASPTGGTWTDIETKMTIRGREALAAQKAVSIASVQISPNANRYKYRQDYDVGDLVAVDGNYDTSSIMRVTEHVEIEDERGNNSYPTLSAIES